MTRKEILRMMPRNSKDIEGANHIVALGYPAIDPALGDIVRCMRVADSAVADVFADLLGTIGAPAAPTIARELLPNENIWLRDRVLLRILPQWQIEAVAELRDILMTIASLQPDAYNNDIRCIEILAARGLVDTSILKDLIDSKIRWWNERKTMISRAEEAIVRAQQDAS